MTGLALHSRATNECLAVKTEIAGGSRLAVRASLNSAGIEPPDFDSLLLVANDVADGPQVAEPPLTVGMTLDKLMIHGEGTGLTRLWLGLTGDV